MNLIGNGFFLIWLEGDAELDGLGIGFSEVVIFVFDRPVRPAEEMFDGADFDGIFFAVAELDFEGFVENMIALVGFEVGAFAFSDEVEAIADEEANDFAFWGMIEVIFADELELAVIVLGVKTDATFGKGDAEFVGLGVFEFAIDINLFVGSGAVIGVATDIHSEAPTADGGPVVDVEAFGFHAGGADELDLFGFLIAEGGEVRQSVEVKFVEGLFGDDWLWGVHFHGGRHREVANHGRLWGLDFIDIASHEFDFGVLEV